MAGKKAFELQFNWIFVLVAGAAILLFFTVLVARQRSIAETSTQATVLKSIDAIITGAGVSTDTTSIISIPNSDIEIGCNRISLGEVSRQYQNIVFFAPSLIKGDRMVTQTLPFSVPYRATNILYATSPQIRYIIIGSSSLAMEINKSLPSSLKKEFYKSMPDIANSNNYKVRFIVFGSMADFPQALAKMPDSDVTAARIDGDSDKGMVEFYQKSGSFWASKGASYYITKSSLIGAVYADTLESYECNMKNVFSRLNLVARIYIERTKKLVQSVEKTKAKQLQCSQLYISSLSQLNSIYSASAGFSMQAIDAISVAAKSLSSYNNDAQLYSCTLVY